MIYQRHPDRGITDVGHLCPSQASSGEQAGHRLTKLAQVPHGGGTQRIAVEHDEHAGSAAVRGEKHPQLVRQPLDRQRDVRTEHDVHTGLMM